ncbi:MAG: hypothetical protein QM727_05475 [Niabella sp.]
MLTKEQIEHLYKFCVKHYVRYYDLQTELVDHLAASIEEKIQQKPDKDFLTALDETYATFGLFGFSRVVSERTDALQRKARKEHWRLFKSWFTLPKLAFTFTVFALLLLPMRQQWLWDTYTWLLIYCAGATLLGLGYLFYAVFRFKRPKQRLLMLDQNTWIMPFSVLLQIPNMLNFFKAFGTAPNISHPLTLWLTIVYVLTVFVSGMAWFESYKNLYHKARTQYPVAFQG